jgi:TPR repeat protein
MLRAFIVIFVLAQCCGSQTFANGLKSGIGTQGPANAASAKALLELGQKYEHGEGVSADASKAEELYCEAARTGLPLAYFQIGWMYLNGRGVVRDDSVGAFWMSKAAQNGVPQAANLLRLITSTSPAQKSSCAQRPDFPVHASKEMRAFVTAKAREAGIDSKLVMAVISVESGFVSTAVSPKKARGLMQLTSETATRFGVQDPFNVDQNLRGGIAFLRHLLKRFHGDVALTLAAYNAGERAIDEWGGIPPYEETIVYIGRVTSICACVSANGVLAVTGLSSSVQ